MPDIHVVQTGNMKSPNHKEWYSYKYHINMKNAFTLLEMLVVIGIIAILVGMGTVYYSSAQKKARDAKRAADLKALQNAMEQQYAVCGVYDTDFTNGITCASPSVTILSSSDVPKDPLNSGSNVYSYNGTPTTTSYDIQALLETTGSYIHVKNQQ